MLGGFIWDKGMVPLGEGIVQHGKLMVNFTEGTKAAYTIFSSKETYIFLAVGVSMAFFAYKLPSLICNKLFKMEEFGSQFQQLSQLSQYCTEKLKNEDKTYKDRITNANGKKEMTIIEKDHAEFM